MVECNLIILSIQNEDIADQFEVMCELENSKLQTKVVDREQVESWFNIISTGVEN